MKKKDIKHDSIKRIRDVFDAIMLELAKRKGPQAVKIRCELGRMVFEVSGKNFYLNVDKETKDPDHLIGKVLEFQIEKLKSSSVKIH